MVLFILSIVLLLFLVSCSEETVFTNTFIIHFQDGHLPETGFVYMYDVHIDESAPTTTHNGSTSLPIGWDGSDAYRIFIRLQLTGYLPAGAKVKKAAFTFQANLVSGYPFTIDAYRATATINESSATWNLYNTSYDTEVVGSGTLNSSQQGVSINIDPDLVEEWIQDPVNNKGIMLKCPDESGTAQYAEFFSCDLSAVLNRPMFTIEYSM